MIAGVYNLGYVSSGGPGPRCDRLLDWWADRLRARLPRGSGVGVLRRPALVRSRPRVPHRPGDRARPRVQRRVLEPPQPQGSKPRRRSAIWSTAGRWRFFHFSGFDPDHPLVLSRYQDRVDVLADPVLERLLAEYATEVNSEGHAVSRKWPYSYGALGDGTLELDDTVRDDVRAILRTSWVGELPSPFTLDGAHGRSRLGERAGPGGAASASAVLLARVYRERPDLRALYPDLDGPGRAGSSVGPKSTVGEEIPLLCAR